MNTVSRPSGAPQSNPEADSLRADNDRLRAILGAIADALTVPLGDDVAAGLRCTRDRALLVAVAARDAAEMPVVEDEAGWLRERVAEYAPLPQEVPGA